MAKINITLSAKKDLKNISDYISNHSVYYAEKIIASLVQRIEILLKEIGMVFLVHNDFIFRRILYHNYKITYTLNEKNDEIFIVRILHHAQNIDKDNFIETL